MADPTNPLLQDWQTPYQLPPFAQIQPEHFAPAFAVAFAAHLAEIDALAADPAPPTFENTVVAFDAAGAMLDRVALVFGNLCSSESPPALQVVERDMAPLLAAHQSKVSMHAGFFSRLDAVHRQAASLDLSEEQRRLLQRVHTDFVRTGATLQGAARERFAVLAEQLATLQTQFAQNVLADESSYQLPLETAADLAGLPDFVLEAARSAARERGIDGYVITLSRSLVEPFLTYSTRRDLREAAWRAWTQRGETPARDNRPLAREILTLRREQARLLGYDNFADYALADRMAGKPAAVYDMFRDVWEPAKASAERERQALVAQAAALGEPTDVEPWDWRYPRRESAREPLRPRGRRSKTLLQPGGHDRRDVRLRRPPVRRALRRAHRGAALSPGRAPLGSAPRRRTRGDLPRRQLRAAQQAGRRMDERLPFPETQRRHGDPGRREQQQFRARR